MKTFSFIHFGEIDINNLEEYYDISIELNSQDIEIDLNFSESKINLDVASIINNFIANIHNYDLQNKITIEKEYNNEEASPVKDYIKYHVEELDKNVLSKFIDFDNKAVEPEKQLLKKLKLIRVGLYPDETDESENFAVFDYTIDSEITDELIVVNTNKNNVFDNVAWES
ncbi:DUF2004 domain-containing protein [Flavobacterium ginsenosidimutans]|uniref:DUF2004 domain-containing protein n=1 Tax=Flavobacterium ginsenosidimutans TaxID=687844 RepID=UPI000DAD488A|nr:DUF2004 domain-containing protein [Flavobacterium ginsenosidimutans]KAF2330460.1 DUF2004 domain-containing protein [Flavobacterium ginsenosidimutans]